MTPDAESLAAVRLFADLEPQHLQTLATQLRRRSYAPGEVICEQGDPGNSLLIIRSGEVRISLRGHTGAEVTLVTLNDGDSFGELALIDGEPRSATATAVDPTELLVLPRDGFQELLGEAPTVAGSLLVALATMVRRADAKLADVALMDVHGRISREILRLNDRYGEDAPKGARHITRAVTTADIAASTGLHPNEVDRYLSNYQYSDHLRMEGPDMTILRLDVFQRAVAP